MSDVRTIKDSTHLLTCHIGKHRKRYYMNCIPLSETENGLMKVLVFGKRNNCRDKSKRIKYVRKHRILSKQIALFNQ